MHSKVYSRWAYMMIGLAWIAIYRQKKMKSWPSLGNKSRTLELYVNKCKVEWHTFTLPYLLLKCLKYGTKISTYIGFKNNLQFYFKWRERSILCIIWCELAVVSRVLVMWDNNVMVHKHTDGLFCFALYCLTLALEVPHVTCCLILSW